MPRGRRIRDARGWPDAAAAFCRKALPRPASATECRLPATARRFRNAIPPFSNGENETARTLPKLKRTPKCMGRSNCFACPQRQSMICSDVALESLLAHPTPIDNLVFEAGAALYTMAEPAKALHCIRHGAIKLVRFDAGGAQRIVRILKQNDIAGLESVFAPVHRHTAVAISEVHSCRISLTHLHQLIARHPGLARRLLEKSHEALQEADIWLSDLVSNAIPARVRLARLLLRLRDGERIHRLSLVDTGAILGLTPETVSRLLKELLGGGVLAKVGKGMASRYYQGDLAALALVAQGNRLRNEELASCLQNSG